jgi:hypothetical protein
MNIRYISSLLLVIGIGTSIPLQIIQGAPCPLIGQTAYKTKNNPTVYYISRACTKRPFPNEAVYFAYFSSWKQVKITSSKILDAIPMDPKGPMKTMDTAAPKKEPDLIIHTPTSSSPIQTKPTATTPEPEQKQIAPPEKTSAPIKEPVQQPIISQPIIPTIPAPTLTGVMADFLRAPTPSEQASIDSDFIITWGDEWKSIPMDATYQTTKASRLPVYAVIRLLKDITFSQPLPFTNGKDLYTYLTEHRLHIIPGQNCSENSRGWAYQINLGGNFAHTHPIVSGSPTCQSSSASQNELLDGFVYNPLYKAGTFVHEAHHAIMSSTHDGRNGGDTNINANSA